MAEMMLINPRQRARRKSNPSPAQRRARAAFTRAAKARSHNPIAARRRRRRNPVGAVGVARRRVMRRKANPIAAHRRRRRNPIGARSTRLTVASFVSMFQDAAIGGAGAVGMDMLMGYINPQLPTALQTKPTEVGAGDAVKAIITVVLGKTLSKVTRGMSQKAALGALTTQARDILSTFMPTATQLAYFSPAGVVRGTNRFPQRGGVSAYTRSGRTPLLQAYTAPGPTPILGRAGRPSTREREGVTRYR